MRKVKRSHGSNRAVKEFLKMLKKYVDRKTTNNYRKMHGKPVKRKCNQKL